MTDIRERENRYSSGNIKNDNLRKTKLGWIPLDWEIRKLGEVCIKIQDGNYGAKYPKSNELLESGVPFLTGKVLGKEGNINYGLIDYISEEKHYELKKAHLKLNDVLFTNRGASVGAIAFVDEKISMGNIGPQLTLLRSDIQQILSHYLYHVMKSAIVQKQVLNSDSGSAMKFFGIEETKKFLLPLPKDKSEQQKIASILSTWDKAIELKEKLIEQKKEQKKGLMQKLLTGEVRLPGFEREWREVNLAKVSKRIKGKAVEYLENGKFPAIDMDYLESGLFKNFSNNATVFAKKNDVLLLWDGSRAGMAFTGVEGAVGSTFVKLECKSIHNIFLQKHLEMNERKIQRLREGSGIPHVPKDFLNFYKIKMPSMDEQKAISNVLNNMDKNLEFLQKEIVYLKQQKQGLMQQLLTGKIRVKV